jgi:hypothetical protein
MATANPNPDIAPNATLDDADLLVVVTAMPMEQLWELLGNLTAAIPIGEFLLATPDTLTPEDYPALRVVETPAANTSWTLTAADFVNAYQLAVRNGNRAILMLGPESASLSASALRDLANASLAGATDISIPYYDLPPRAGLVNSAILYPLTRALFASRIRFPLAIDLGLSLRMAERLATAAQRFTAANQNDALIWPINEAAVAGYTVSEIYVGPRTLPQPTETDINAILALVTGSLFADIDVKAAFWQRARPFPPASNHTSQLQYSSDAAADIAPMLDAFHLAYTNLREIWSLVLPPNSLFGLKRLSIMDAAAFRMPENLWARIVFDFLLAYRLRTINRGHLLGALIPLYLAWVASHINITALGVSAEEHIELAAAAFEAEKPYLVARWRWPDRFNP